MVGPIVSQLSPSMNSFNVSYHVRNPDIGLTSRKRGITLSKKWRIISPTDMGSPFDSEQLLCMSYKQISSVITEILGNVKVFARRQGYGNTSTFSLKIA